MSATAEKKQYTFQAEITRLLDLLANSLYQSKEIAVRELISNASDALDKMRFISLSDTSHKDCGPLEIVIEQDEKAKRLTIHDTGIGMTDDELKENLGTIAHSGSLDFLSQLTGDRQKDVSLIGQFGVGFYSAFMIADQVTVRTRSYKQDTGWEWQSDGSGSFSIAAADDLERGTSVMLDLKEGVRDFLNAYRIESILKKYSSFIPHPIKVGGKQVNDIKPIWVEPKSQLTDEQYHGFYQHLTHHTSETPSWFLHVSSDSPIQFHAVLFCPQTNSEVMGYRQLDHGLHLCAKRILVQSNCTDLLPEYLRFLHGLVDSEDLPLNVSRETLQDNAVFRKIRATLVKKVLDRLDQLSENRAGYLAYYRQFGSIFKEGISRDFEHRERVAKLLRFISSASDDPEERTSLDEYIGRSPEGQKEIYYLGGPDLPSVKKSPNLEIFRKRGLEVLFLIDPIDEFVMASLDKYEDRPLKTIDAEDLDLPDAPDATPEEQAREEQQPARGFGNVVELFRAALGDRVKDVRVSKRLTDSACCLVSASDAPSAQMEKIMQLTNKEFRASQRIFELNPSAPLIEKLCALAANPEHTEFIKSCALQLFDNARTIEGLFPDSREAMVDRIQEFMEQAADRRSPIIQS